MSRFNTSFYIIAPVGVDAPCKIGLSGDVHKRLAQLQTGNPARLGVWFEIGEQERRTVLQWERNILSLFAGRTLTGEWVDAEPMEIISCWREWMNPEVASHP